MSQHAYQHQAAAGLVRTAREGEEQDRLGDASKCSPTSAILFDSVGQGGTPHTAYYPSPLGLN